MKNLLGKKIKGYYRISEIVDKQYNNVRIKYRCKKCHCYVTNERIKHTSRCFKNTEKDPCYFYIFYKDECNKMNNKQIEDKKIEMDEKNDKEK